MLPTEHAGRTVDLAREAAGTPNTLVVAIDMEKGHKGALQETVSVVRTFAQFRLLRMQHTEGTRQKIDSLLFANIPQMVKHGTLSEAADRPADGKSEVILFSHTAKEGAAQGRSRDHHRAGGPTQCGPLRVHHPQTDPLPA